jgi:hypothetical protein
METSNESKETVSKTPVSHRPNPRWFWEVANRLGFEWRVHRDRSGRVSLLEWVYMVLSRGSKNVQPHEQYKYEKVARLHWYGKRIPGTCDDLGGDVAEVAVQLWATRMISTVWALRAVEWALGLCPDSRRAMCARAALQRHADSLRKRA